MNTPSEADLRQEMACLEAAYPGGETTEFGLGTALSPGLHSTGLAAIMNGHASSDEFAQLRAENQEMHKLIEELKQIFEQATQQEAAKAKTIGDLQSHIAEMERLITERDSQVAMLTDQITELEQHIQNVPVHEPPPPPPTEDELAKMADELEKERCKLTQDRRKLDQDREQLQDDEESLMKQMREMEVQMAKERAEMARQRTDLQRLHGEVRHELDQLQRGDGALKDRLQQFQRRHQAVFDRGGRSEPAAASSTAAEAHANGKGDSGLIRRFFGRG